MNLIVLVSVMVVLVITVMVFQILRNRSRKQNVPIYYINLDKSTARRRHMETTFGDWGTLMRFPAVHKEDNDTIAKLVDMRAIKSPQAYFSAARATGLGAGTLLLNNALLLKKAFNDGLKHVLILEDDMTDLMVPYWRWNVDEIVELANVEHPGWYVIQLQSLYELKQRVMNQAWKFNPSSPFFPKKLLFDRGINAWGAGANLYSRKGMEFYINLMFNSEGKFDCLSVVERLYAVSALRCNPDNFLWKVPDILSQTLLVIPPMFATVVNEGSTGLRTHAESRESDHDSHLETVFSVLRASILAKSAVTYQIDFGTELTAFEAHAHYTILEDDLKKMLGFGGNSTVADHESIEFVLHKF